jgi:hypothetical protein
MNPTPSEEPRARFTNGAASFADRATFDRGVEHILCHGVINVVGTELPAPLEEFLFRLVMPDNSLVDLGGRLISRRADSGLIQVVSGGDALFSALLDLKFPARRKERRVMPRHEHGLMVLLSKQICTTIDVSPGGLCVATTQAFPLGTIVEGLVYHQSKQLPFRGEVRWCVLGDPAKQEKGKLGLRLLSISNDYFDLFKDLQKATAKKEAAPAPAKVTAPVVNGAAAKRPPNEAVPLTAAPKKGTRKDERRNLNRLRKRYKIRIGQATGFTFDVSPTGFGVEMPKVLAPGVSITGTLYMDQLELPFNAQVRWARAGHAGMGIRARMGLLLTFIDDKYRAMFPKE